MGSVLLSFSEVSEECVLSEGFQPSCSNFYSASVPGAPFIKHVSHNVSTGQAARFTVRRKNGSLRGVRSIPRHLRRLVVAACVCHPRKGGTE